MKKYLLLSVLFLILPFSVFGAVEYERTPSGFTIQNPVSFDISFDDFNLDIQEGNYWTISISSALGDNFQECLATTTTSHVFVANLPLGEYHSVSAQSDDTLEGCEGGSPQYGDYYFEGEGIETIFEVIGGANFVPISGSFIAGAIAYVDDLAVGIWTMIAIVIGFPLGFWVIGRVIGLIKFRG